jgi:hypothetical protein
MTEITKCSSATGVTSVLKGLPVNCSPVAVCHGLQLTHIPHLTGVAGRSLGPFLAEPELQKIPLICLLACIRSTASRSTASAVS